VIRATLFTDPACPWGYSANPAQRVLEWRYGHAIEWRLVTIGLREVPSTRPWDAGRSAAYLAYFRHQYGMPFSLTPKARPAATGRGCRAVVVARLDDPGSEWKVLRALYFANFTTPLLLDEDGMIRNALNAAGLDGDAIVARLDDPDVAEAYERDRSETRSAAGTAAGDEQPLAHRQRRREQRALQRPVLEVERCPLVEPGSGDGKGSLEAGGQADLHPLSRLGGRQRSLEGYLSEGEHVGGGSVDHPSRGG
jgi:2-hydroxychromene-2-carboxylate isomerase